MKDHHYYLVRKTGSDEIRLVYVFGSDTLSNGVTYYDISTKVFYSQKQWGLWGWDCGTSVNDFEQHREFDETLAEVTKEEVDALFDVMKEATDEVARWIDADRVATSGLEASDEVQAEPVVLAEAPKPEKDTACGCRYDGGKYPFFTFMNDEIHERVCIWSDLLFHGTYSDSPLTPDGSWGEYCNIPLSVFERACELHKTLSNKFVRQFRDLVLAKTGITLPLKEYTPEEIEEEKAKIKERGKALRAELEAMAKLRSTKR